MDTRSQETDDQIDHELQPTRKRKLPVKGSPEFRARCDEAWDKVIEKYAWTAQHAGIVLRKNPLKLPPHRDYVFSRLMKVQHGFRYLDSNGHKKLWWPDLAEYFSRYLDDGERDVPFTMVERVEFIPGEAELTEDPDGCRVLNLWRPPTWEFQKSAPEPTPFLEHVAYLFDNNQEAIAHVLNFSAHLPSARAGWSCFAYHQRGERYRKVHVWHNIAPISR
jgi:hypothetical protein